MLEDSLLRIVLLCNWVCLSFIRTRHT